MIEYELIFVLAAIASIMVGVVIALMRVMKNAEVQLQADLAIFVMVMMVVMFLGASYYLEYASAEALTIAVGVNMFVMVIGLVAIFSSISEEPAKARSFSARSPFVFATSIVINEAAMGLAFELALGTNSVISPSDAIRGLALFSIAIGNPWFFVPLTVEALGALWLGKSSGTFMKSGLTWFLILAVFAPVEFSFKPWIVFGTGVSLAAAFYFGARWLQTGARGNVLPPYWPVPLVAAGATVSIALSNWSVYSAAISVAALWFFYRALLDARQAK